MKKQLALVPILLALPLLSSASSVYMSGGAPTRLQQALELAGYGLGSGFGAKNQSCLLCHNSEAGGAGNLNAFFGVDYQQAAQRVRGVSGGNSLGVVPLAEIFNDLEFAELDSDEDGSANGEEFANNTDPAGNIGIGGGAGGGCGRIDPSLPPPPRSWPSGLALLILPLAVLLSLKRRSRTV